MFTHLLRRSPGLLACLVAPHLSDAQAPGAQVDSLAAFVQRTMESSRVPSISVAVARGNAVVWERSFGFADVETGRIATPATPYLLASVTKPVVATVVMRLIARGRLQLNTPVVNVLPELVHLGGPQPVLVRHLLGHTSGLPPFFHMGVDSTAARMTPEQAAHHHAVRSETLGAFQYSNLNYVVLGMLVERVTGRPLEALVSDEVLTPARMTGANYASDARAPAGAAVPYEQGKRIRYTHTAMAAAEALYASARDLLQFAMHHAGWSGDEGTLLIRADYAGMQRADPLTGWGYGWQVSADGSFYHLGSSPGVRTTVAVFPREQLAVALLSNGRSLPVGPLMDAVRRTFRAPVPAAPAERAATPVATMSPPEGLTWPSVTGQWKGSVRSATRTFALSLAVSGDRSVSVQLEGNAATTLGSAEIVQDRLRGNFPGVIPLELAVAPPVRLNLSVRGEGPGRMKGWLLATAQADSTGVFRAYFDLPFVVELTRVP